MSVFTVTTGLCPTPGKPFYFRFECDCGSVQELCERLSKGEIVFGNKLGVVDDGRGGLLIRAREPFGLGAQQAGLVQNCDKYVWEPEA